MKTFTLPTFDVYTLVKDSAPVGSWITEIALDEEATRSVAEVLDLLDDETVAVLKINLAEGSVVDVTEEIANAWLELHSENLPSTVPVIVTTHLADELERAWGAIEGLSDWFDDYRRQINAEYRENAL